MINVYHSGIRHILSNGWITGPAAFVVWCSAAYLAKKIIYVRLSAVAHRTKTVFDDILIDAVNFPLNLVILFIGLALMERFLPLRHGMHTYMLFASKIVFILCFIVLADRLIKGGLAARDERTRGAKLSQGIIIGLLRVIMFAVGGIILLDSFGVSITPLLASLGVTTLAIALALQPTLANFFAGMFITFDKSVNTGDLVQLQGGEAGRIDDIGWRTTRIALPTGNTVVLPNSKLADSILTNYTTPTEPVVFTVNCAARADADAVLIENIAVDAARETIKSMDEAVKEFEPIVRFVSFDAAAITFGVVMKSRNFDGQAILKHEFIKRLHARFKAEGISPLPKP